MNTLIAQIISTLNQLKIYIPIVLMMIGALYLIHLLNWLTHYRLNRLGIYPRHITGLPGIVFSPFLHGDFNHLFFNSIPLFVLIPFMLLQGWHQFLCITITIVVLSGLAVWLVGRRALHIGASSLIMGYWSYLIVNAYHQGTVLAIALAAVCLYYFGSLVFSLFPGEIKVSWEGHVCGFLAGIAAIFLC